MEGEIAEISYLWERYFAGLRTELKEEQVAALICREFGWTFEEYQNQPSWFIDIILEMLRAEGEEMRKRTKK